MDGLASIWASPTGRVGLAIVIALSICAILAPLLAPYLPSAINVAIRFSPPSPSHWLGTDHLGRDLLSRVLYGARIALGVSVAVTGLALMIGALLGVGAAYSPPLLERAILVVFDLVSSYPTVILALAFVAVLGPGVTNLIVVVTVVFVPQFGRVARAQALALRHRSFLEAEVIIGASPTRILFHHLLPNIIGPLIVLASMNVPTVITLEAGLSFLGLGVRPPLASWGSMLYDGFLNLNQAAWPVVVSAGALSLATLGFTLFGEALQAVIDPLRHEDS
ncbi:ABC transporter permease [Mesorhizobium hawassense]|uniref:ABC transporter permease n=1 Tax=Mesorhizobium hawassense TaxID=1209954 RepID=A0A330HT18_9HYPH|nr:ABC transporter permease [Mesorhizobium hawassense]RAZ91761.1 ABC transporter permease [Mesorhizobium hawassense]